MRHHHIQRPTPLKTKTTSTYNNLLIVKHMMLRIQPTKVTRHHHLFSYRSSGNEFKICNEGGPSEPTIVVKELAQNRRQALQLVFEYYNSIKNLFMEWITTEPDIYINLTHRPMSRRYHRQCGLLISNIH